MAIDLSGFSTETRNPATMDLDVMSPLEIARVMNRENALAVESLEPELEKVAEAIEWAATSLEGGGRLIYMGAGTSGRLGVLDAAECPPTFGVSPESVVGLIAGGGKAASRALESNEDSFELGEKDLCSISLTAADTVVGLSASGRTPYVLGGLTYAKGVGSRTVAVACNAGSAIGAVADIAIEPVPGPEVVTGSTRLKAGSVQKMVLNMISTGAMARIGKVYQNLMVDVRPANAKLQVRSQNIVMEATGCGREQAASALAEAGGHAKTAIVSILLGVDAATAEAELERARGRVRAAVENGGGATKPAEG